MYSSNKESRLVLFASVLLFRAGNALAPFLLLCGAIAILVVISVLFFFLVQGFARCIINHNGCASVGLIFLHAVAKPIVQTFFFFCLPVVVLSLSAHY